MDFLVPTPRREKLTRVVGGRGAWGSTIKTINCAWNIKGSPGKKQELGKEKEEKREKE